MRDRMGGMLVGLVVCGLVAGCQPVVPEGQRTPSVVMEGPNLVQAPLTQRTFDFGGWFQCNASVQNAAWDTATIGPNGGALPLPLASGGPDHGQAHYLWVMPGALGGDHTFTMTELTGRQVGVRITAEPAELPPGFQAILVLDARRCSNINGANIAGLARVREANPAEGDPRPGVWDTHHRLVWGRLDGLSEYAIAVPQ